MAKTKQQEAWSDKDLVELCKEWQKRLRLQDWEVQISFKRKFDMALAEALGDITYQRESRRAVINILDPLDYDPAHLFPIDIEHTVVHELLHIPISAYIAVEFECDGPESLAQEQAINSITTALVNAKRGIL